MSFKSVSNPAPIPRTFAAEVKAEMRAFVEMPDSAITQKTLESFLLRIVGISARYEYGPKIQDAVGGLIDRLTKKLKSG